MVQLRDTKADLSRQQRTSNHEAETMAMTESKKQREKHSVYLQNPRYASYMYVHL